MNESIKLRDSWCVAAELDKSIDTISKLNYEIIALKEAFKWKDARIKYLSEEMKRLEKIQAIEFYESRGDKAPKSA